jgi:CheY-like chemotaxis protein
LTRLLDLGIEPFLISSSLVAVVGQRLVRKICPACKVLDPLSPQFIKRLPAYIVEKTKDITSWKGAGCEACNFSGYSGRFGLFEVLIITPPIREAIAAAYTAESIKKTAEENGFQPMSTDGIRKAFQGMTTIEEVFRVAPPEISEIPSEDIITPAIQEDALQEEIPREEPAPSFSTISPRKILVADDSEIVLKILSNTIESEGYLVTTAKTGLEALKLSLKEKPDLIITDFLMPGMDGVTLIKKLKSQLATRYIPIIMLTAKKGGDAEVISINAGADDYLTKPVNSRSLLARINRLLQKPAIE